MKKLPILKILEIVLKASNEAWGTDYKIIDDKLFLAPGSIWLVHLRGLKSVLIDEDRVILDFGDDVPVTLKPDNYTIGEEART